MKKIAGVVIGSALALSVLLVNACSSAPGGDVTGTSQAAVMTGSCTGLEQEECRRVADPGEGPGGSTLWVESCTTCVSVTTVGDPAVACGTQLYTIRVPPELAPFNCTLGTITDDEINYETATWACSNPAILTAPPAALSPYAPCGGTDAGNYACQTQLVVGPAAGGGCAGNALSGWYLVAQTIQTGAIGHKCAGGCFE